MAGLFDRFKTSQPPVKQANKLEKKATATPVIATASPEKAAEKTKATAEGGKDKIVSQKAGPAVVKGKSGWAYRVILQPLITEKAAELGALGKYAFMVDSHTNKVEVKKAIRSIYGVDPLGVAIINVSGKHVRYGRVTGATKGWKKAIVTLKPGDKIEIYEGV